MFVYRIALEKYTHQLLSPGTEARWNSKGNFVIYTAASRALACLENIVHRDSEGLKALFKVMIIDIPDSVSIQEINVKNLPVDFPNTSTLHITRQMGNNWLYAQKTAVLKVPSAIIKGESNYLLNPAHSQFKKIKIKALEDFEFDNRLKS
ncbi:MAG: RES family NAD+ phosphorylase [Bacteroidetes bacterium]|nr:RES family NAD+ phosphorylase [Bacteroidota bacterium]MBS1758074.1 RES family NAD+ phosphorylase [Bacteroidota bacterium]